MLEQLIMEILHHHRGKFFGVLVGLVFGVLVIVLGFLQTVFVSCCIYIGFVIGKRVDDNESIRDVMERVFKEK